MQNTKQRLRRTAHEVVRKAIKSGALKKQTCEKCGDAAEAHHEDYSKPLDVMWLCSSHHRKRHYEEYNAVRARVAASLPVADIGARPGKIPVCLRVDSEIWENLTKIASQRKIPRQRLLDNIFENYIILMKSI